MNHNQLADKSKWYRIKEREHTRYRSPEEFHIFANVPRIIVRAGYLNEPTDIPDDLLWRRVQNHILNWLQEDFDTAGLAH